ncbi:MAG: NAD-dependent succinate-semialdehyde dehydrogenase [Cyclobacteriaceae bacterium]
MQAINPATEERLKEYADHSTEQMNELINSTNEAFKAWRETSFEHRASLMKKAAQLLRDKKVELGALMTAEMGKPLADGEGEAEKCAWVCDFYADNAEEFLTPELIDTDAAKSYVSYQPLGIVFAIMPWNFPLWQVFRFAAPGLMAGNAGLLKHAPNVPGCAQAIEDIFLEAGFPKNIFTNLFIDTDQAAEVIANPLVKAVTLTGSTRAGKAVAKKAGEHLKKCVLELGGSDPYIVLEDADLDEAVKTCATSRLINNGQSCISAKRFIVPESIKTQFEEKLVEAMSAYQMGDPTDRSNQLGTMAREDLRDELAKQVDRSIAAGARCILGGKVPDQKGFYYPATILTDVKKGTPAYEEEMFGPVASIIAVKDEAEAIEVANDSIYGLGAAIFSKDTKKAEEIAETKLQAGACFVNSFVKSDPRLPFGGINESGFGRELSHHGIKEFMNAKTVYVK